MANNRSAAANVTLVLVTLVGIFLVGFLIFGKPASAPSGTPFPAKGSPSEVLQLLKDGNERFSAGKSTYPHGDPARIGLAETSDQGNYAYATVLSCSDSRVPVELIFDAGIMGLFVFRAAGNVNAPNVQKRMQNQERRIDQGMQSGELTPKEAGRLEAQQAKIQQSKERMQSDGQLTGQERQRLHNMQDRSSQRIYRQKHDAQKAPVKVQ